jgi:hypothetical protein
MPYHIDFKYKPTIAILSDSRLSYVPSNISMLTSEDL